MCIFARQLYAVLDRRGKDIGSLYAIYAMGKRQIHPQQILRLRQAAAGDCSISVALNPDELDAVIDYFKLDADEVRQLRAALTAESFYRFFLDRVDGNQLLTLAEQFFQVLLSGDTGDIGNWMSKTFEGVRGASEDMPDALPDREARVAQDLEPVIGLYEEAHLWLTTARSAKSDSRRVAYTQLALTLLREAQDLLRYPSGIVINTPEQSDWQEIISSAIDAIQARLDATP